MLAGSGTFNITNNTACEGFGNNFSVFLNTPYFAIHKNINWTATAENFKDFLNDTYYPNVEALEVVVSDFGIQYTINFTGLLSATPPLWSGQCLSQ